MNWWNRNHTDCSYPKVIPLICKRNYTYEKLQHRKVKAVLRYHRPSKGKYPEKFAHHLLFICFTSQSESGLKSANSSYVEK